jgi:hypothetical protein
MSEKASVVRVNSYTKDMINRISKKKGISQGELILRALEVAEKMNFEYDLPLDKIAKNQTKESNRIIGFLKQQDKNMSQLEQNIYSFYSNKITVSRRDEMESLYIQIDENIDSVFKEEKEELTELFREGKAGKLIKRTLYYAYEKCKKQLEKGEF